MKDYLDEGWEQIEEWWETSEKLYLEVNENEDWWLDPSSDDHSTFLCDFFQSV